jgi:hypothetical protein
MNRCMQWIRKLDGHEIRLCVRSGLAHLHMHLYKDAELEMSPHEFLTDTGWNPFVERKNDEEWGAKLFDPIVMVFWSLVCPFHTDNTQMCAEMLGGEENKDTNILGAPGAPIIKSRHDSDCTSKHCSTQQDSAYQEKAKPSSVFTTDDDLVGRTFVMDQKYGKPVFDFPIKFFKEHQRNINDNLVCVFGYCYSFMIIKQKK